VTKAGRLDTTTFVAIQPALVDCLVEFGSTSVR